MEIKSLLAQGENARLECKKSLARNPRMQNMLRMVGFGENLGSGFPTIVKTWSDEHWLRPHIEERLQLQTVSLTLTLENRTVNRTINQPNEKTSDNQENNGENHTHVQGKNHTQNRTVNRTNMVAENRAIREKKILDIIEKNKRLTITEIAQLLGVSRNTTSRGVKRLQSQGKLRHIGPRHGGHWEIIGRQ